jgi:hypothetical protein
MVRWRREAEKRWRALSYLQPLPPIAGVYLAVADACEPTVTGHYFWSGKRLSSRPESFGHRDEAAVEAMLLPRLRDIFGNPFRSAEFHPSWRTGTVVSLARHMYEGRDFSALPILADALEEAGCSCAELLEHCRDPAEHARGCWALDAILGRS